MTAQDSRTRETECDLLVVGSGAGGLSAATTAAWHGLRVVVVEKDGCAAGRGAAWQLRHLRRAQDRRPRRVLNSPDGPVPGLYAVGCDQASVMGGHYPSGGINIGPALTFGYIAGRHCAGVTEYENRVPVLQNDGV